MACGSGCCGPPKADKAAGDNVRAEENEKNCDTSSTHSSNSTATSAKACPEPAPHAAEDGDIAAPTGLKVEADGCKKGCCAPEAPKPPQDKPTCATGCCSSKATKEPTKIDGCTDSTQDQGKADSPDSCSQSASSAKPADHCTKGCCVKKAADKTAEKTAETPAVAKVDKRCQDACCEGPTIVPEIKADCTKGCCSPKTKEHETKPGCTKGCCSEKPKTAPTSAATSGCTKGCCGAKPAQVAPAAAVQEDCGRDSCSSEKPTLDDKSRAKGCCSKLKSQAAPTPKSDCTKGCCTAKPAKPVANKSCTKGCCSKPKPKADPQPKCCQGKTSPCCDDACLEELALLECEKQRSLSLDGRSSCDGGQSGRPCRQHALKTRALYSDKLEALGCICRTLLQMGLETCCDLKAQSAAKRRRALGRASLRSSSRSLVHASRDLRRDAQRGRRSDSCCSDSSCGPSTQQPRSSGDACGGSCCEKPPALANAGQCADACCDESPRPAARDISVTRAASDPEKNGFANREHVLLTISGMTCTGCETKLSRSLGMLAGVQNLKTSLVLARAEFDLVNATMDDVSRHIARTTEFTCERIVTEGSSLDLALAAGKDAAAFVAQPWPDGVLDMAVVDSQSVRVAYDARRIGGRAILQHPWQDGPVTLSPPRADPTMATGRKHVRHLGYATVASALLTIPVLVMAWAPLPKHDKAYAGASLALATVVQCAIAGPFYPKAIKALVFSKVIEMDLLIVLSTSAAFVFSVVSFGYLVAGRPLSTGQFFETSTLLVTLIMLGRFVAALARQRAVESISLQSLQASTVLLVSDSPCVGDEGGICEINDEPDIREIDARLLQYGDVFKVLPDARIATDGTVVAGASDVDESMVTGEALPVAKAPSAAVLAGSINGSGTLVVRLTQLPGSNTISRLTALVDEAKLSKPKIQNMADQIASYFVPVVVSLTVLTFAVWIAVGIRVRHQSASEAAIRAITYAMTVLIVSCPCAIGLAVPMVIVIASGLAAEHGVVFTSAETIEAAKNTSHVVFDKTGTLTQGKLTLISETYVGDRDAKATQSLLLGLVQNIKHPVSFAVASHLAAQGAVPAAVADVRVLTGKGVTGTRGGAVLAAGNAHWLAVATESTVQAALGQGGTVFCFVVDGALAAVFGLQDAVRAEAPATVATLQRRNIRVHVLSGDEPGAVQTVAQALGIPTSHTRARCSPAAKRDYIQGLLATADAKGRQPVVMFCGDGTNDAVALSQATIGVHVNHEGSTDIAKAAADVVLMNPRLDGILVAMQLSHKAMRRVAFNFGWSFVYNLFAILLGAGAFVRARIPPEYAGLGELVSVLPVILAAVLLRWSKL